MRSNIIKTRPMNNGGHQDSKCDCVIIGNHSSKPVMQMCKSAKFEEKNGKSTMLSTVR